MNKYSVIIIIMLFTMLFLIAKGIRENHLKPREEARYGCKKASENPPVWRCGEYGRAQSNQHILYESAWVTENPYSISAEDY